MLEHVFHHVQSVMGGFCNLQDTSEIDYAIRKTALSISKEESEGIRNSYFDVYKTCLEIFEDDIERDYMLFFKVKIYTAIEKANKKYHEDFYKLKEEEAIEAYKEYISAIADVFLIAQDLVDGACVPPFSSGFGKDTVTLQSGGNLIHAESF